MNTILRSENAASTVIGHIIILGLTITGVALVALLGMPIIKSIQDMDNIKNTEQTFTLLDSRASQAILGDSPMEKVDVDLGSGVLAVEPNGTGRESYIVVNSSNFSLTIPMGKVTYRLGDREIAYEEGGIWSKYPSGGSVMLSPPEVHYNGVTLTLPVINLTGAGSVGGKGMTDISFSRESSTILYPNDSENMKNPLDYNIHGKVFMHITSDFYDAWAEYARNLVYTNVSEDPATRTAHIELTVVPSTLGTDRPINNPIVLRGVPTSGEPLGAFSFKLQSVSNNLKWDIRTPSGDKRLIIFFKDNVSKKNEKNAIDVDIGYEDTGKGYDEPAETWVADGNFIPGPDNYTYIDLLNKSINITYSAVTVASKSSCQPYGGVISAGEFNSTDFSWDDRVINESDQLSIGDVIQHYISIMANEGDITFYQCASAEGGEGSKAPDSNSTMLINYNATGALTYLHISDTETKVKIS